MHPQFMSSIAPTKSVERFIEINHQKSSLWLESFMQFGTVAALKMPLEFIAHVSLNAKQMCHVFTSFHGREASGE
jgi:hypothetical protein